MSVADLAPSAPAGFHPVASELFDADFDRRWAVWQARGIARTRAAQRRVIAGAIVLGLSTFAAVVAYALFSS